MARLPALAHEPSRNFTSTRESVTAQRASDFRRHLLRSERDFSSQPRQPAPAPPVAKKAQDWKIPVHSPFPACEILKRVFEFEGLSGGLGNVAEYAIAWSRSRHGGASERYNDLADELPMERRGRASDCQRSYDFTQNDLPPPLLAPAYHRRGERGTPVRCNPSGHSARRCCSLDRDGAACPFLGSVDAILLKSRIPTGRSVRKPYPSAGPPRATLGSFRSNEPSAGA